MTVYSKGKANKVLNCHGETLIELLISIFILTLVLTIIIAVFISGRAGVVDSWARTEKNECAANVLEQLKALSYHTLKLWESNPAYRTAGEAVDIKYAEVVPGHAELLQCANSYDISFDLLAFEGNPLDEIMKVNVRVKKGDSDKGVELGSLIRKGESP